MKLHHLLFLALPLHGLSAPAAVIAQDSPREDRIWVALGWGGGLFGDTEDRVSVFELAWQRGSYLLALRGVSANRGISDWTHDAAILFGRASTGKRGHASIAAGPAFVDVHYPSQLLADGNSVSTWDHVIGIAVAVEGSFAPSRFLGVGVQGFGNLNEARSFIGVALVLKVGSLN